MDLKEARYRYLNDPKFHGVVSMFESLIIDNKISIYELQDALVFATNKLAMENRVDIFGQPQRGFIDTEKAIDAINCPEL